MERIDSYKPVENGELAVLQLPPPPQIFPKIYFIWIKKNSVKVKISIKLQSCWNSSKFTDIYNIVELDIRWYILSVMNWERFSHFYQLTHYSTTHNTSYATTRCRNGKKSFQRSFRSLFNCFSKTSLLQIFWANIYCVFI